MEIQKIQEKIMDKFYDMCVDDGQKHDIVLEDSWMEERFIEAGLIENSDDMYSEQYPKKVHEHMVLSKTKACYVKEDLIMKEWIIFFEIFPLMS